MLAMGSASTLIFIKDLKEKEFQHLQEENQRIVATLIEELFADINIWEEAQIIEGPYGFRKGEIKETIEKFIKLLQDITGNDLLILNVYNSDGRIVASNFSEFEGQTADNLGDFEVEKVLNGEGELTRIEELREIHPQIYWKKPEGKEKEAILEVFSPVEIDEEIVGVVSLYFLSETDLKDHIISMSIITGVGILITVIFIYLFFIVYIIRPLRVIRRATHPIGKGEFMNFIKLKHGNNDEIGRLANDFNKMLRGLNSLSSEITRLKEVGKMKSEFISIVAHQLRTPLTGIKWVLETISEKELSEEIKSWIRKVQDLNERMVKIINDFLDASRIEKGKMGYTFKENVDLVNLLNKVIELHKINIERKHLILSFPRHRSLPVYIKADSQKLATAFDNLLDNAINYTPENGTISFELTRDGDFVTVKITDTGIGIAEEDIPKLFTRFFRSKKARATRPAGSGLGLFIARNIIRDHGCTIWVESKINKGTSFYVKFPVNDSTVEKDGIGVNK